MANLEMKVMMLLFGFAAALYGLALFVDGGPVYRDPIDRFEQTALDKTLSG